MKNHFPTIDETLYDFNKRVNFVYEQLCKLAESNPDLHILDVGCGTGELLSIPLAEKGFNIVGLDIDEKSIEYAKKLATAKGLKNVKFRTGNTSDLNEKFDVLILSEVIEHVREYDQLLDDLNQRLKPGGHLIITLPNGYGPFEADQYLWKRNFLLIPGLASKISQWRQKKRGKGEVHTADTCNEDCPHVNWFTWQRINDAFKSHGFQVSTFRPRTFVVGSYISLFFETAALVKLKFEPLCKLNSFVADFLPAQLNSGWMFLCQKVDEAAHEGKATTRAAASS